ncbi:MAG: aminotransferase class IV [Aggregatilineales bacterium]
MFHVHDEIVLETLRHNIAHDNQDEYTIRILLTGGISPDNISPGDVPRLIIMVQPFKSNPATWYSDGAKVITIELERVFTGAKSTSYLPAIVAMRRAKKQNAIEALYCTPDNHVLEGTTTNLFMFKNGTVITPPAGVLPGITRRIALELCEAHYPVAQHHILLDDLYAADEVFITASNKRIVPIVQINERQIATGQPGDQTRHIMSLFDAITFGQTEPAMT